ncbi:MAG TPA: threonine synthase [Candidatus Eremiobacteraceae bacterium]|nr:threonine synthase [Candidatus Eremiobacteraceae bacterium]
MKPIASALSHLECSKCGKICTADAVQQLCGCGGPLLGRYDLQRAASTLTRAELVQRPWSLWRYGELLPIRDAARHAVSLGETVTPIVPLTRAGSELGIDDLRCKDEGMLPTGSFKARGAAVGVSRARELGVTSFAMPTNGNAGGAWAMYARRADMDARIVMPKSAPEIHRFECSAAGAEVTLVDGVIADAGKVVAQLVRDTGAYDASTLKEPYRIEGKKTLGFELAEQFEWQVPDVILYPTGGGVGLIGIHKALLELRSLGFPIDRLPRMVAVQAAGCAPIVRAFDAGSRESEFWPDSKTSAFGINVPKALGDFLVLDAVYDTEGCAIAVADAAIDAFRRRVAMTEGMLLCLEGAATIAAAAELRKNGWIRAGERVLTINTGSGLKSPN